MQRTKVARPRLRAENLERRLMLAGDVSVAVLGGNLRIIGDADDNQISITETAPGNFQVSGLDGTTINHQPVGTGFETTDFTKNLFIRMGEGNDHVALAHVEIHGIAQIFTGGGNDTVDIVDAVFDKNVHIETGIGDDRVHLGDSPAALPTIAESPLPTGVRVEHNLNVQTGFGDDEIVIADTHIGDNALLETGAGDDNLVMGFVSPPVTTVVTPASTVAPPEGFNVTIGRYLIVLMGRGEDTAQFDSVRARVALISTGEGNDRVIASNSSADYVYAALGEGDDVFDASGGGNTVGHFVLQGGPGDDTLIDGPNNQVAHYDIFGIEHSI